jgi:hypothetical protein
MSAFGNVQNTVLVLARAGWPLKMRLLCPEVKQVYDDCVEHDLAHVRRKVRRATVMHHDVLLSSRPPRWASFNFTIMPPAEVRTLAQRDMYPRLLHGYARHCYGTYDRSVRYVLMTPEFLRALSGVRDLDLEYVDPPRNTSLSNYQALLREACAHVQTLRLRVCTTVPSLSFLGDSRAALSRLRSVNISYCDVSDVTALRYCATVSLTNCLNLRDVSSLKRVRWLSLHNCVNVTDVSALGAQDVLNLSNTSVSDVSTLLKVRVLNLTGCVLVTSFAHSCTCGGFMCKGVTTLSTGSRCQIGCAFSNTSRSRSLRDLPVRYHRSGLTCRAS